MRTPTPLAVVLAALLVTAGALAVTVPGALADDHAGGDAATIDVSATGTATAEPDRALVYVSVVATADDAATARERVAADANAMRDALRAAGVADEQVRSVGYSLGEEYRRDDEPRRYRAVHRYEVTLTDLDATGAVVDLAVENGANRVESVRFTLSEDARQELRADALADAMTNARAQADAVAAAADLSVAHVAHVSTGLQYGYPVYADAARAEGGASTTFDTGSVDVTATVSATYNATA